MSSSRPSASGPHAGLTITDLRIHSIAIADPPLRSSYGLHQPYALRTIVDMCTRDRLVVLVGTAVHDGVVTEQGRLSWWYAGPRNGHISLFSREALRRLGQRFGLSYASLTPGTHLLTRGVSHASALGQILRGKLRSKLMTA